MKNGSITPEQALKHPHLYYIHYSEPQEAFDGNGQSYCAKFFIRVNILELIKRKRQEERYKMKSDYDIVMDFICVNFGEIKKVGA